MPMNFPDVPTNGQSYQSGGVVWSWNGTVWNPSTAPGSGGVSNVYIGDTAPANPVNGNLWWNSAPGVGQLYIAYNDGTSIQFVAANNTGGGLYLPLTGGTLTGPLLLAGNATAALHAVPKQQLDPAFNDIGRNLFHNPLFRVQQRGQGPWTAPGYTADRWNISMANDTASTTIISLTDADRTAIGDEAATYAMQTVFTGSATTSSYNQFYTHLEDIRRFANKTFTISFYARATSGTPKIGVGWTQTYGTGGSPSAATSGNFGVTPNLSSTWQRYVVTGTIPSMAGKVLGTTAGTDFFQPELWYSEQGTYASRSGGIGVQSGTVQVWGMQMEVGGQVTPLEKPDYALDLIRCQRFYQVWTPPPIRGARPSSTNPSVSRMGMPLPVTMRAAPTCTLVSALPIFDGSNTNTITSFTASYCNAQSMEIDGGTSSNWPTSSTNMPVMVYLANGGSVTLSAEL